MRTISQAIAKPRTTSIMVAPAAKPKLLRMEVLAVGCWSASVRFPIAKLSGRMDSYHPPTGAAAAKSTPRCGMAANATKPATAVVANNPPRPRRTLGSLPRADFVQPPGISRPKIRRPPRYSSMLMPSITDARAYGLGLDATSFSPSKICTLVTSRMSNIRGVPSSVKLQMKTMVHPANSPGRSSGSKIRRNRAQRPAEQLWAASSSAGSILARAAVAFKNTIGYRWRASTRTTAGHPPSANRSSGWSRMPQS